MDRDRDRFRARMGTGIWTGATEIGIRIGTGRRNTIQEGVRE